MKGEAYAAGTVLNAVATFIGSAFPVDLKTKVFLEITDEKENYVVLKDQKFKSNLADEILKNFNINARIYVESNIPQGSGLGSSSAFANALIIAASRALGIKISSYEILKLNAEASIRAGVSYTGALDDAAASLLAKLVITDNKNMKILKEERIQGYVAVLLPRFKRGKIDVESMRRESWKLKKAIELAMSSRFCEAMVENTKFYCNFIGYPLEIAEVLWKNKICCGLSGNGPSFCAIGSKDDVNLASELWKDFGEVIISKIPEDPVF
ncbi:MAG: shikimate kinase [Archaeoglobaceae archaeon]|nr:shikimate kinase [Archaeoglobaceae archaeon]MCX8151747.1 shikimate kinase [Archaeoglobaceae archaeon]MDW8014283.1 shikimate kinase [Archaeoglobaceae archaeon]